MKLNNKGFAISGIIYTLMFLFLILIFAILGLLGSRKLSLDKLKQEVSNELENNEQIINVAKIDKSGANAPSLVNGMIPVIYNGVNWVKADYKSEYDQNWYNYEERKWANIVLVNELSRPLYQGANAGYVIDNSDILAFYVWIPRYKYKLFNVSKESIELQPIEVVFEKSTLKSSGSTNGEYLTHPSFTFGITELKGIWVSKYETTGTLDSITILPEQSPIISESLSDMYYSVEDMFSNTNNYGLSLTDVDAHVMKNIDWGAVAYLSNSNYGMCSNGICTEVSPNGTSLTSVLSSTSQSTTNTVYGIYDMSGGKWEYTMGNINTQDGFLNYAESDFMYQVDDKYCDSYPYNTISNQQAGLLGDATSETMLTYGEESGGWFGDRTMFTNDEYPWFIRGGCSDDTNDRGIFAYSALKGGPHSVATFRSVIINHY